MTFPTADIEPPLLGGLVLGLTVFWNAVLHGRVTGVSGALHRAAARRDPSSLLFVLGLALGGAALGHSALSPLPARALANVPHVEAAAAALVLGVGARVANGCTSGHALCGLARLSPRSLHATLVFMAAAIGTATLLHGPEAAAPSPRAPLTPLWRFGPAAAALLLPALQAAIARAAPSKRLRAGAARATELLLGVLFAAGLLQTGMADRARILAFLNVRSSAWDFLSLPLVFVGALPPAMVGFALLQRDGVAPVLAATHGLPTSSAVDARLLGGAALFGIGWGWLGLCPGPALVNFGASPDVAQTSITLASIALGLQVGGSLK